jgi:hypothetical protein
MISATLLGMVSPRTHREILPQIRQDGAMIRAKAIVLMMALLSSLLFVPSISAAPMSTLAAKKAPSPIPSPQPKWPPVGFKGNDGVYAKIPTTKELVGLLSAKTTLQKTVKQCEQFSCGAVIVAAENGCVWWEVNSTVFRIDSSGKKVKIGSLSTYSSGSEKRVQKTIFLISGAPYEESVSVSGIKVVCHRSSADRPAYGNSYNAVESENP